ncbi:MAG: BrnT family toxin [Chloroflexi bacterium]|nr:BrnT family toxin [Chloroflexota bacterium]MDA1270901.1 BrnT family toxin [Chloroflexota bacterium]
MKHFDWNADKNETLKRERGVSFEEVTSQFDRGGVLDILEHPNQDRYPGQRIFVIEIDDYAYLVPFVESETGIFLKTVIPSRKATNTYLRQG